MHRTHAENLPAISRLFTDDDSDELTVDPIFKNLLDRVSGIPADHVPFFQPYGRNYLMQLDRILYLLKKRICSIRKPEMVLLDIDFTLFDTFGKQEGEGFNYHYSNHGYHPLLCYDRLTRDLLKAALRPGNVYTSSECCSFLKSLLMEYLEDYSDATLYLRGDSGFANPDLFELLETNGTSYAILLKVKYFLGISRPYSIRLSDSIFIKSPTFLPKMLDKSPKICGEAG